MQTAMKKDFARVPSINHERSVHDLSHRLSTAFDADYVIPIGVWEVLPGDSWNVRMNFFARFATLLKPLMDNAFIDIHCWFGPNRLLWEHWEEFQGAREDPDDDPLDYTMPQMTIPANGPEVNSLSDYFGLPCDVAAGYTVNALPYRMYNLLRKQWYRDQNLQDSPVVDKDDGPDTLTDYTLFKRGKRHDIFTSCLPWPQKAAAVTIPVGSDSAPIEYVPYTVNNNPMIIRKATDDTTTGSNEGLKQNGSGSVTGALAGGTSGNQFIVDPNGRLVADLTSAFATTINDLRLAVATQEMYELDARGGTRYVEALFVRYGVISPDFRLQRIEYLGGGTSIMNVHPVPQTSPTSGGNAQAQLASFATSSGQGIGFNKAFVEHGYIMVVANVRADLKYFQGLDRMWSRETRVDFFEPALAHLGEEAILNKEIYFQGTVDDDLVFGYQERNSHYRFMQSRLTGIMRPSAPTPLDMYSLAEEFASLPVLGDTFLQSNTPVDRVIAVTSEPHVLFDAYFDIKCARPIPMYGTPRLGSRL